MPLCKLCNGLKWQFIGGNLIDCPACNGTGELTVGTLPGQDWPNLGVNLPAGAAVAASWNTPGPGQKIIVEMQKRMELKDANARRDAAPA